MVPCDNSFDGIASLVIVSSLENIASPDSMSSPVIRIGGFSPVSVTHMVIQLTRRHGKKKFIPHTTICQK